MYNNLYYFLSSNDIQCSNTEDYCLGINQQSVIYENLQKLQYELVKRGKLVILHNENMSFYKNFHEDFVKFVNDNRDNILVFAEGTNDKFPFTYHQHNSFWVDILNYNLRKPTITHSDKEKDFLILVGEDDANRIKIVKGLEEKQLLDQSLVSVNSPTYDCVYKLEEQYDWKEFNSSTDRYSKETRIPFPPQYETTKFSLVMETVVEEGSYQLSEKSYKPIIAEHPFVIFGPKGFLKYLRSKGFQTFGDYIDESYDEEENVDKRIQKIIELCEHLKNIDYKEFYAQTKNIRESNRKLFFNEQAVSKPNTEALNIVNHFFST